MNKLHFLAIGCFCLAIIFYVIGSSISLALGALGILFECIAWASLFAADKEKRKK